MTTTIRAGSRSLIFYLVICCCIMNYTHGFCTSTYCLMFSLVPVDFNLYNKFWELQKYFNKPSLCYDAQKWLVFKTVDSLFKAKILYAHILDVLLVLYMSFPFTVFKRSVGCFTELQVRVSVRGCCRGLSEKSWRSVQQEGTYRQVRVQFIFGVRVYVCFRLLVARTITDRLLIACCTIEKISRSLATPDFGIEMFNFKSMQKPATNHQSYSAKYLTSQKVYLFKNLKVCILLYLNHIVNAVLATPIATERFEFSSLRLHSISNHVPIYDRRSQV